MLIGGSPTLAVLDRLQAEFALAIKAVRPIRSAWRIETDAGVFFLKRVAAPPAALPFVLGLYERLAERAPDLAPRVLRALGGERFFYLAGRPYLMLTGIAGREADYLLPGDIRAVAAALAGFHEAARGYRPAAYRDRFWYGTWPARLAVRLDELERFRISALPSSHRFGRLFAQLWPDYHRQARCALSLLRSSAYRAVSLGAMAARGICHHDLAHHNMILTGDGVRFLDLDYAVADTTLHDLTNLAGHLMRLFAWDPGPVMAAFESYWHGPPAKAVMEVLAPMLLWPQDFWQIGRQYFEEHQPWTEDDFYELLARKCGEPSARLSCLRALQREYGPMGALE